ncbi:MAG TPA: hypothetical protein VE090_00810 [Methylomirabilota bacterium]|nr:hypothetical protein [Methylomirabilota bacterium]
MDQQSQQTVPSQMPSPTETPAAVASPVTTAMPPNPVTPQKSSKLGFLFGILGLIIVVVVGVVLYKVYMGKSQQSLYKDQTVNKQTNTTIPSPTPIVSTPSSGDPQLDQQNQTVDTSMSQLNTDINNADKGLQDQPVNLSQ